MENTQQQILDGRELRGEGNARLLIDGVPFLNFSGCNYLALTDKLELRSALSLRQRLARCEAWPGVYPKQRWVSD
mgnify:CR=1 FL=1